MNACQGGDEMKSKTYEIQQPKYWNRSIEWNSSATLFWLYQK